MIYLDSAATSFQKPLEVKRNVITAMDNGASPGRGTYKLAMNGADYVFKCREFIGKFFNVPSSENVIFTSNATHALNIAINSLVKRGDKVLISGYEHNAVTRPLYAKRADIIIAESKLFDRQGTIDAFEKNIKDADCVICTHVSNVFGFILPIYEIAKLCKINKVPLIIDASQSAGVLPVDFEKLGADFIAMPGHKGLLGPQGTGVLLVKNEATPLLYGGTGSESMNYNMPNFLPDRLEAGTHNVPGIYGLYAGANAVKTMGIERIFSHERKLCTELAKEIIKLDKIETFFDENCLNQSGVLSIVPKTADVEELAQALGRNGVCVRAGLHCAPMAHETAGTLGTGTLRFSFSPFNTASEIKKTAEILKIILNNM